MRIHVLILAAGLLPAALAGTAHAQTNLVANGSFEAGPTGENVFTNWGWVAGSDGNSDFGVAKATGGFEVAEQGNYFAYFRGHPVDNSQDCLGTGVSLKAGAVYNISYYLGTDGPLTNGAAMWAQIGTDFGLNPSGDTQLPTFFPNSANAIPYQLFSTDYVATSTSSLILSFHGVNATNGIAVTNGILLDNISMVLTYPQLNVNRTPPGSLTFAWQFTNSPYRLQASGSLNPTIWVTLTNTPSNAGGNSHIILSAPGSARFYRLTLP
jgi:hypothetical protein